LLATWIKKIFHQDSVCIIKTISKFCMSDLGLLTVYLSTKMEQSLGVTTHKKIVFVASC
jgi:hypothetical protein